MHDTYQPCRQDPRLDQLLADPLIRLVMSSDGVDESEIRGLARAMRGRRPSALQRSSLDASRPLAF